MMVNDDSSDGKKTIMNGTMLVSNVGLQYRFDGDTTLTRLTTATTSACISAIASSNLRPGSRIDELHRIKMASINHGWSFLFQSYSHNKSGYLETWSYSHRFPTALALITQMARPCQDTKRWTRMFTTCSQARGRCSSFTWNCWLHQTSCSHPR